MPAPRPSRACRRAGVLAALLVLAVPATAAQGAVVAGTLYRDADGNGLRDPREAPLADVPVKLTDADGKRLASTVTDARGGYAFTTRTSTPGERRTVEVISGWFASGCLMRGGNLCLGVLGGPDDDFDVVNEFVRRTVAVPSDASTVRLDGGFTPDWGDPGTRYPGAGGPFGGVDPALRFSGDFTACGETRRCQVGAVIQGRIQVFNSGTEPLTGLEVVVTFPPQARFDGATGLQPLESSAGVRPRIASAYDEASRSMTIALDGELPPGGASLLRLGIRVVDGPFTTIPTDRSPWPVDAHAEIGHVDQGLDVDAANDGDPGNDADLGHSINWPAAEDEDDHDALGFNVVQ